MKPAICFPLHDTDGTIFDLLDKITPDLKKYFSKTFISFSPKTLLEKEGRMKKICADGFFQAADSADHYQIGDQFSAMLESAAGYCESEQQLHICASDRLSFALLEKYRDSFIKDVLWSEKQEKPVIFTRSKKAWQTHPKNYYAIESMVSSVGQTLLGKVIDFCWCYGTIKISRLKQILPKIKARDWTVVTKYALEIQNEFIEKEVDWLSWEDPFVFNKDYQTLKEQRESDENETEKRLAYAIPMIKTIINYNSHRSK